MHGIIIEDTYIYIYLNIDTWINNMCLMMFIFIFDTLFHPISLYRNRFHYVQCLLVELHLLIYRIKISPSLSTRHSSLEFPNNDIYELTKIINHIFLFY